MRINKENSFVWTFQNEDYTYYTSAESRAYKTISDTIGDEFDGVWVSDRFGSYHIKK